MIQIEMSERSNKHVKSFIELAGAIAVLIGLIFVGLELRQNTVAIQAATFQNMTHASSDFLIAVASEPELRRVWSASNTTLDEMSTEDRDIYGYLLNSFWLRMQNAFRQWQFGTLSDEDWLVYHNLSCGAARRPLAGRFLQNHPTMTASFKKLLEDCDK